MTKKEKKPSLANATKKEWRLFGFGLDAFTLFCGCVFAIVSVAWTNVPCAIIGGSLLIISAL